MKKYIFLDTNNWIYLSNGFNILSNKHDELHLKIFDKIKKWTSEDSLEFLVNDIVLTEWKRNKPETESQIKEIENKYKSYFNTLNCIKTFINSDIKEVESLKIKLKECFEVKTKQHRNHIKEVELFLFNNTTKIDLTDNVKIEATNLALEKKAPFIGDKKNSMADALILLNSIDYLKVYHSTIIPSQITHINKELTIFPESFFVSSNKGDFSSPNDKEKIHPDLEPFLKRTNTQFFFTLGKLINSIDEEFLSNDEEFAIEHADDCEYCEFCETQYPSIKYSDFFLIHDENKGPNLVGQLILPFLDSENKDYRHEDFMSSIRTANCVYCGAEFIECTCGELNFIESLNLVFSCKGQCGNIFNIVADIDKKGVIHNINYEIITGKKCQGCNEYVENLNDFDLCVECEDKYSYG